MSFKRLFVTGLIVCLAVMMMFAGCAPSEEAPSEETPDDVSAPVEEEAMKAALLTSGPINDGGWNTIAYNGLLLIEEKHGFEISNSENIKQDDQVAILRDYARKGFDLIIGHGYEFGDAMLTVAPEFPEVYFAQIGGGVGGSYPNLTSGELRTGELGYIMGMLAGELTESNKIGFIGAMEIPTIVDDVAFLKAAVKTYYPGVEVAVAYTGSWVDIAAGKEAAKAMISEGADVLVGIGDACDAGAIQACDEANEDVWFIGWSGDMNSLSPETVANSAVQSIPTLVDIFAQQLINEESGFAGVYGVKEGVLQLGTWAPGVPEDVKDFIISEYEKFNSGEYTRSLVMEMINAESEVVFD